MNSREFELSNALKDVEDRISRAAGSVGRDSSEITLIAVTKTYPVSDARALFDLGVRNFGENRVDEGHQKSAEVDATWHFQGQIQSRKLKEIVKWADYLHSLDSAEHITKLGRICEESERTITVFIQLSLDGALGRGGAAVQDLPALATAISKQPQLQLAGLMCVPPAEYEYERAFAEVAKIKSDFNSNFPEAKSLSAGMSNDFEVAIAYGATHLRIGSQILGSRS